MLSHTFTLQNYVLLLLCTGLFIFIGIFITSTSVQSLIVSYASAGYVFHILKRHGILHSCLAAPCSELVLIPSHRSDFKRSLEIS
jgi:hypothetical protein